MVDKISKYIQSAPFRLQIAKDGKWESALSLSPVEVSRDELQSFLERDSYSKIAVEALFTDSRGLVYVLGLQYNNSLFVKSVLDFLQLVIDGATNYHGFPLFIQNLDEKLIGQNNLLQGEPDLIRIGVVNHWFTVGPCLIWQRGQEKAMTDSLLREKLQYNPNVIQTKLNYQGMSFIFNIKEVSPGVCHWMKSPCSNFQNSIWRLDQPMILQYLHEWQDFSIS